MGFTAKLQCRRCCGPAFRFCFKPRFQDRAEAAVGLQDICYHAASNRSQVVQVEPGAFKPALVSWGVAVRRKTHWCMRDDAHKWLVVRRMPPLSGVTDSKSSAQKRTAKCTPRSSGHRRPRNPGMFAGSNGGETGIRTLGGLAPTTVFETAPFDHSGTSPRLWARSTRL